MELVDEGPSAAAMSCAPAVAAPHADRKQSRVGAGRRRLPCTAPSARLNIYPDMMSPTGSGFEARSKRPPRVDLEKLAGHGLALEQVETEVDAFIASAIERCRVGVAMSSESAVRSCRCAAQCLPPACRSRCAPQVVDDSCPAARACAELRWAWRAGARLMS